MKIQMTAKIMDDNGDEIARTIVAGFAYFRRWLASFLSVADALAPPSDFCAPVIVKSE